MPPVPEPVGLYLTELATPTRRRAGLSVASIERRLSGLGWGAARRGHRLDRRRSETGPATGPETGDGAGWIATEPEGLLLTLRGKTGWRSAEIGRDAAPATCPVGALDTWLRHARLDHGPLFRRVSRDGARARPARLSPQHVPLLVQRTAATAGLRADLPEAQQRTLFSGHSLRAGLASHAQVHERLVQKQLGHASVEMTRRYQRKRDRFAVNLTKAAGL